MRNDEVCVDFFLRGVSHLLLIWATCTTPKGKVKKSCYCPSLTQDMRRLNLASTNKYCLLKDPLRNTESTCACFSPPWPNKNREQCSDYGDDCLSINSKLGK